MKAPLGVFAVLGNHDFWSGPEVTRAVDQGLADLGVQVLRNRSTALEREGQTLVLAGVDDYWADSYNLKRAMDGVERDNCLILLSHNPDVNEDVDALGLRVDLMLAGHTHGGQIVLPFIGAPFLPSSFGQKYRAGLVRDGERLTYVSRGLGVYLVPFRLNCPAEVTRLTLTKAA